jgi:hypothetical protein
MFTRDSWVVHKWVRASSLATTFPLRYLLIHHGNMNVINFKVNKLILQLLAQCRLLTWNIDDTLGHNDTALHHQ